MKILVTNDDGIYRRGLWVLAKELRRVAEVVVVAPDREQSAVGAAISLRQPLHYTEVNPMEEGIKAYSVSGTPSDSVILALEMYGDIGMVFSGVNEGANLGYDVLLSGTVGAALQGYLHGLPSVALSMADGDEMHFDVAGKLAGPLADHLANGFKPKEMLLNVNLPNLPIENIKGIHITSLAKTDYKDLIAEKFTGKRKYYRILRNKPLWDGGEGTDAWAVDNAKISITPLQAMMGTAPGNPSYDNLPALLMRNMGLV